MFLQSRLEASQVNSEPSQRSPLEERLWTAARSLSIHMWLWYYLIIRILFPWIFRLSAQLVEGDTHTFPLYAKPLDISGHTFLLGWTLIGLSLASWRVLKLIYILHRHVRYRSTSSFPCLRLGGLSIPGSLIITLVLSLTLVYVLLTGYLLCITLIYYHTALEKALGSLFSLIGYLLLHRRPIRAL